MVHSPHLLGTKLFAPPPRERLVERSRLLALLDRAVEQRHRVTTIAAPAGYGKSTLVSSWLGQRAHRFAWLSLDRHDNDLRQLFAALAAALRPVASAMGSATALLLATPQQPTPAALAAALLADLGALDTPTLLVLDDIHALTEPDVHEALSTLLERAPPQLHVAIVSRTEPPLPLARLRASGLLTELRSGDLRFTVDEVATFFRHTMRLEVTEETARLLEERTEGWAASLQLAALSLLSQSPAQMRAFVSAFTGSQQYVIDYLLEEVLSRQDDELRDFLSQTALLSRFCAPLCDAVTGRSNGHELLLRCERAQLFLVPLDQDRRWFRYHHLFAEALRTALALDAALRATLLQRAAAWLGAHGYLREAITYALEAEAWELAAQLVRQAADDALLQCELGLLGGWLSRLPQDALRRDPELLLLKVFVAINGGDPATARALLSQLDDATVAACPARVRGRFAAMRALMLVAIGTPEMVAALSAALELVGEDDPIIRQFTLVCSGLAQRLLGDSVRATDAYARAVAIGQRLAVPAYTMYAAHALACNLIERGQLHEARAFCTQLRARFIDERGVSLPTSDLLLAPLALCAYSTNDLPLARELAQCARDEFRRLRLERSTGLEAEHVLILALAGLGDWDSAWRAIDEARRLNHTLPHYPPHIAALEAELQLRLGNQAEALRWAQTSAVAAMRTRSDPFEPPRITYARLLLARGELAAADALLAELEANARAGGRFARLISVRALQALVCAARGERGAAHVALGEAVQLAAPQQNLRRLLDEGPALARLLLPVRGLAPEFVDALLAAFAVEQPWAPEPRQERALGGATSPLTSQELRVLRALAEGLSYQDIAEQLVISVGTTRWHIHNIYAKLGVSKRSLALRRARELQLI